MEPGQKEALSVLGYFFIQHGRPDKALTLFKALDVLFPDDAHVLKSLSYAYMAVGEPERALDAAARYLRIDAGAGDDAAIHLIRSRALWRLGQTDEARRVFQRFIEARRAV